MNDLRKSPGRPRALEENSRNKAVLKAIRLNPGIKRRGIMSMCDFTIAVASGTLKGLMDDGLIKKKVIHNINYWYLTNDGDSISSKNIIETVWNPTKEGLRFRNGPIYMECTL